MSIELSEYQQELYTKHVRTSETRKMGDRMTVVHLTLKNGFEIVGSTGCEDVTKFDMAIGRRYAMEDALNQLDKMMAYARANTKVLVQLGEIAPEVLEAIRKEVREGMISAIGHPMMPPRGY